jgi:hypothetical protein
MNARTKTLFHFTKSLDILLSILEEGFWPRYSLEDITWLDGGLPRLAWPMVSFCDIPISRLRKHTEFYGNYGLGLHRERWQATGLHPVLYVSPDSMLRNLLRELLLDVRRNPDQRVKTASMVVLAHCKPLDGWMEVNGQKMKKNFYSECEWRFLPWVEGVGAGKYGFLLKEEDFHNKAAIREANEERRNDRMLTFLPADVRYLLVKSPDDVSKLVSFIEGKMLPYASVVRDMLKTRIMVLDEVLTDF